MPWLRALQGGVSADAKTKVGFLSISMHMM